MIRVRAATARDLSLIGAWAPHSAWETLTPQERETMGSEEVISYAQGLLGMVVAAPQHSVVLIAEAAGQPVGYIVGAVGPDSATGEPNGFLLDVFVLPQVRRHGVGQTLQQAAERCFTAMGLRKVKMWSGVHNQAAVQLATRSGFKPEGLIGVKEW